MAAQSTPPVLQRPPGYRDPGVGTTPPGLRGPPRKPILPPAFPAPKKRRRSCCRVCCCCFCVTLLLIILSLLVASAIFYLWLDPKLPTFHLSSFRVTQFAVSPDPDGASLSAATSGRVELKNPNGKLAFYYGDTHVEVSVGQGADEIDMESTKVPGFKQGPQNATSLKVDSSVKNQVVDEGVAKRLAGKYKDKNLVVSVTAKSKIGVGVGGLKTGMLPVNLRCGGVSLNKLQSNLPACDLNTLKWINIKG